MKKTLTLLVAAAIASSGAFAKDPDRGRGQANNPNAVVVATAVFDEVAPGLFSAFCVQRNANALGKGNLANAYNKAQGDEGLNKALNTTLCLVDAAGNVLVPEIFDWPDEGCTDDRAPWDADPLPNEVGCTL